MKRSRNAFTLVELMVVVTIIVILATIAVPSFLKYRDASLTAKCVTNLRCIQDAREAYFLTYPSVTEVTDATAFNPFLGEKTAKGTAYATVSMTCPKGGGTYVYTCKLAELDTMPTCPNYTAEHVYSGF